MARRHTDTHCTCTYARTCTHGPNLITKPASRKRVALLEAVQRDQFNVVWADLERAQHVAVSQAKEIEALKARVVSMENSLNQAWAPLAAGWQLSAEEPSVLDVKVNSDPEHFPTEQLTMRLMGCHGNAHDPF